VPDNAADVNYNPTPLALHSAAQQSNSLLLTSVPASWMHVLQACGYS
jgi:hypothetical protein